MDSTTLARIAYHALLKEVIMLQQRISERATLVRMFDDRAIDPVYRTVGPRLMHFRRVAKGEAINWDEQDRNRLAELYETIDAMEEVFEKQEEGDMKAMAEYFADKFHKNT